MGAHGWLGVVALLLSSCGSHQARAPGLRVLLSTAPRSLDPRYATDAAGVRLSRLLYQGLVRLNPRTMEPEPGLASSWRWESPSSLVITLRPEVRFASGAPLRAEDVCATLAAFASPELASPHRAIAASVGACELLPGHDLRLRLKEPRATLLTDLEVPILRADQARLPPHPETALDGLGPFVLVRREQDLLELAPSPAGPHPAGAHLTFQVVHDEDARALRLLSGEADLGVNVVSPTLLEPLRAQGIAVHSTPGANLTYLLLDNDRSPLNQAPVRHAIAQALDRSLLARTMFAGYARVADALLPPESWAALEPATERADSASLAFDPESARAVFSRAGVHSLRLLTSSDRLRVLLGRALAQMLGDVGVSVELTSLESGALFDRLNQGDYELALLQIPELTEPNVLRWFFHSSAIPGPGHLGANRARFRDPQVDAWLDEAAADPDLPHRAALYRSVLARMDELLPVIPLFHEDQLALVSPRAAFFYPSAEGRLGALASFR